jgi:hypothetical protein
MSHRQEVVNVRLSDILSELGIETKAENKIGRSSPDFILRHPNLGKIIGEAEFNQNNVTSKLEIRVNNRFSDTKFYDFHAIFTVIYPEYLKNEENLKRKLPETKLKIGLAGRKINKIIWYEDFVKPRQISQAIDNLSKKIPGLQNNPKETIDKLVNLIEQSPKIVPSKKIWKQKWKQIGNNFEIDSDIFENESRYIELIMKYYLNTPRLPDNKRVSRKVIHKDPKKERNWHGPFDPVKDAEVYAHRYHMNEGEVKPCGKCKPHLV